MGAGAGVAVLGVWELGVRAPRSSPEKVEDSLGRGQDVEGHRQRQALSEVGQVELGASKLPFHVGIVLWQEVGGSARTTLVPSPPGHSVCLIFPHPHVSSSSVCQPLSSPHSYFRHYPSPTFPLPVFPFPLFHPSDIRFLPRHFSSLKP